MVIGVVGLGTMGGATGRRLLMAGHRVLGFDIDPRRVELFAAGGGDQVGSVTELAAACDVVLTWLPTPRSLLETAVGLADGAHDELAVVDLGTHTLASKDRARALLLAAGVELMDAPVSGSGRMAAEGRLVVYASGTLSTYERVRPIFGAFGTSRYVGPFGHGLAVKYVANLLVAVHTAAAAEAHALASAAGLDPQIVQEVVAEGVGSSRMWEERGPMMASGVFAPPAGRLDNLAQDVAIIAEYAGRVGSRTPLLGVAAQLFDQANREGLGHLDAAVLRRLFSPPRD
jgi:L-threonate 2-dehydrogenase